MHEFQAHGKWIVCGEHAVVRGGPALVLPLLSKTLTLYETEQPQIDDSQTASQPSATKVLSQIAQEAQRLLGQIPTTPWRLGIHNHIPLSAGLGASAALCLCVSRWLAHHQYLSPTETLSFAKQLEHLFHQRSSGLDVAGCAYDHPVLFDNGNITALQPTWTPLWYLCDSGLPANTRTCVQQVTDALIADPTKGRALDKRMQESVALAVAALTDSVDMQHSVAQLKQSIELAQSCFDDWGLTPAKTQAMMDELKSSGAIATKLTGSGNGGYLVSLWREPPPAAIRSRLIPVSWAQTEYIPHLA